MCLRLEKNVRPSLAFGCLRESGFALWLTGEKQQLFCASCQHFYAFYIILFCGWFLKHRVITGLYIVYIVWWSLQSYRQGGVHSVPFVKMPALSFHQCEQGLPTATELWTKMLCVMADMQLTALLHGFGLIYCDDVRIKYRLNAVIQLWSLKKLKN